MDLKSNKMLGQQASRLNLNVELYFFSIVCPPHWESTAVGGSGKQDTNGTYILFPVMGYVRTFFFDNSLIALHSFSFTQKIIDHSSSLSSVRSIYKSDVPSSAIRTPSTARMPTTVWMQATTVAPATSNSKDDNNITNAHNSTNASNSRNKSDNRTTNTVWMPAKAGMLLKSQMAAAAGVIAS